MGAGKLEGRVSRGQPPEGYKQTAGAAGRVQTPKVTKDKGEKETCHTEEILTVLRQNFLKLLEVGI